MDQPVGLHAKHIASLRYIREHWLDSSDTEVNNDWRSHDLSDYSLSLSQ